MKGWILLGVVLATHYGYPLFSDGAEMASWAFYVLRGVEGAILFYLIAQARIGGAMGLVACWIGILEESQTAICGLTADDSPIPLYSGLCLEQFGPLPYAIAAATAVVYLKCYSDTTKRPSRQQG
jgi:hypothetical protein